MSMGFLAPQMSVTERRSELGKGSKFRAEETEWSLGSGRKGSLFGDSDSSADLNYT